MVTNRPAKAYSIGWDVGGWNCDRNSKSRDAIVIITENLTLVGEPWRGNLREAINKACTARDWLSQLFNLCKNNLADSNFEVTLGIDTPLGFSTEFQKLITSRIPQGNVGLSDTNQYLYRKTERLLFERHKRPLSAIKDMIGSQATKGMHVLAKFAPRSQSCGVWCDDERNLTAIEAYPASCKESHLTKKLLSEIKLPLANEDIRDAAICAVVAHLFRTSRGELWAPDDAIPASEGWIWLPKDAIAA
jgi:predicted nuclease with RNAse H fold